MKWICALVDNVYIKDPKLLRRNEEEEAKIEVQSKKEIKPLTKKLQGKELQGLFKEEVWKEMDL